MGVGSKRCLYHLCLLIFFVMGTVPGISSAAKARSQNCGGALWGEPWLQSNLYLESHRLPSTPLLNPRQELQVTAILKALEQRLNLPQSTNKIKKGKTWVEEVDVLLKNTGDLYILVSELMDRWPSPIEKSKLFWQTYRELMEVQTSEGGATATRVQWTPWKNSKGLSVESVSLDQIFLDMSDDKLTSVSPKRRKSQKDSTWDQLKSHLKSGDSDAILMAWSPLAPGELRLEKSHKEKMSRIVWDLPVPIDLERTMLGLQDLPQRALGMNHLASSLLQLPQYVAADLLRMHGWEQALPLISENWQVTVSGANSYQVTLELPHESLGEGNRDLLMFFELARILGNPYRRLVGWNKKGWRKLLL